MKTGIKKGKRDEQKRSEEEIGVKRDKGMDEEGKKGKEGMEKRKEK